MLLAYLTMLITKEKYRLDEILIITRDTKDRIALLDCSKVQGATRDGARDKCVCQNAGSILSDELGKLKCYKKVDKPIPASKLYNFLNKISCSSWTISKKERVKEKETVQLRQLAFKIHLLFLVNTIVTICPCNTVSLSSGLYIWILNQYSRSMTQIRGEQNVHWVSIQFCSCL